MVSEDLVSVEHNGVHSALAEKASKFQVVESKSGPIFLGAIGRYDLSQELLMARVPKMVVGEAMDFLSLRNRLPSVLQMLVANRPPSTIAPDRDGLQACLVGYDHSEQRVRAFVFIVGDGFAGIETTIGDNCTFCLGWLPDSEMSKLNDFSSVLGTSTPRLGIAWAARELGKKINQLSVLYPNQVGKASYYAALDGKGLFALPPDLPLPSMQESTVAVGAEMAMEGTNRFFVGSIMTPLMGGTPTTGNDDGGAASTQTQNNPSVFLGAYSATTDYLIGNQVSYANGLYQAIAPTIGNLPTNTLYWVFVNILLPAAVTTTSVVTSTIPRTSSGSVSLFSTSIAIPAGGGPYRILVSYAVYLSSSFSQNGCDVWASDGTDTFAFFEYFFDSGQNGSTICASCSGFSPVYNAGAGTITIILFGQNNQGGSSTLNVVGFALEGPGTSGLTLAVVQAG